MKLISVDPGYGRTGFAILSEKDRKPILVHSECFETEKHTPYEERLTLVGRRLEYLIKTHGPNHMAIEKLFFAKNKKTAMHIAEVRGMCIYQAKNLNIDITEYTPNQIKNAVTGNSNANKKDIIRMIPLLITMNETQKKHDDEYDAIAAGITHLAAVRGVHVGGAI